MMRKKSIKVTHPSNGRHIDESVSLSKNGCDYLHYEASNFYIKKLINFYPPPPPPPNKIVGLVPPTSSYASLILRWYTFKVYMLWFSFNPGSSFIILSIILIIIHYSTITITIHKNKVELKKMDPRIKLNNGWNVNGRLIWSSQTENFWRKQDFLKGSPKFPNGISKREMCSPFAHCYYSVVQSFFICIHP